MRRDALPHRAPRRDGRRRAHGPHANSFAFQRAQAARKQAKRRRRRWRRCGHSAQLGQRSGLRRCRRCAATYPAIGASTHQPAHRPPWNARRSGMPLWVAWALTGCVRGGGGGGCMKRHVGREERDALGERLHLVRAVRARAHPRHAQGALRCRPLRAREVGGRGGGARVAHRYLETGTRRMPRRPGALKAPCSRFPGRGESQPASQPVGGPRRLHGRGQAGTCTHAC